MIYTLGKFINKTPHPIGQIIIRNDVKIESDDTFLNEYMKEVFERGIKITECLYGKDGSIGERDRSIESSDPLYLPALHSNLPPGYCIIELLKSSQAQHRKTA